VGTLILWILALDNFLVTYKIGGQMTNLELSLEYIGTIECVQPVTQGALDTSYLKLEKVFWVVLSVMELEAFSK